MPLRPNQVKTIETQTTAGLHTDRYQEEIQTQYQFLKKIESCKHSNSEQKLSTAKFEP